MTKLSIAAALLLAFPLLAGSAAASLVPPAGPILGLSQPQPPESPFADPVFGEPVTCNGVERRMVLLNPRPVIGEPVHLRLLLRNDGSVAKPEFMASMAYGNDLRIFVTPPAAGGLRPYEYLGYPMGSGQPTAVLEMLGIERYRLDFRMSYDAETVTGAAFDVAGVYRLDVVLNCRTPNGRPEPMRLGTFTLEVGVPDGEDRRAMDLLDDLHCFQAIQLLTSVLPNQRPLLGDGRADKFARVVESLPKARLRPYAMLVLADHLIRQGDARGALLLYDQLRRDYPWHPLAETVLFYRLQIAQREGDEALVWRYFNDIWTDPQATALLYPKNNVWDRHVKPRLREVEIGTQWMIQATPGPDPERVPRPGEQGPRIVLSEEVQQMLGLPEVLNPEDFGRLLEADQSLRRTGRAR